MVFGTKICYKLVWKEKIRNNNKFKNYEKPIIFLFPIAIDFGKIKKQKKTRYKNFESVFLRADYPSIVGNIDEQIYKVSCFTTFCPFDSLEPYTDTLTDGTYTIRIKSYEEHPFIFWENDN